MLDQIKISRGPQGPVGLEAGQSTGGQHGEETGFVAEGRGELSREQILVHRGLAMRSAAVLRLSVLIRCLLPCLVQPIPVRYAP